MTYLQLCQKVNTIVGMQGSFDSVVGAAGYQATIATMVADAWMDIQNLRRDWSFLKTSVDISTTAGKSEYTIFNILGSNTSTIGSWIPNMFFYNESADQKHLLQNCGYDNYIRESVDQDTQSSPRKYAIDPVDQHIYLNPPDGVYSITGYYYSKPIDMSLQSSPDSYTPIAPVEFHRLIIYQAAAEFSAFLGNGDLFTIYSQKASSLLGDLMRKTIPARRVRTRGIA